MLKLDLDIHKIEECHTLANQIAHDAYQLIYPYTTVGVERAILRLMGVNGCTEDELQIPHANVLADLIQKTYGLQCGAALPYAQLAAHFKSMTPAQWIEGLYKKELSLPGKLDFENYPLDAFTKFTQPAIDKINQQRLHREQKISTHGERPTPWLYVIVATGNIYEDLEQAEMAVRQGADVIAVIRATAQSLLDYIPQSATNNGIAGTFATQENFRLMRTKLDALGDELGRYIRLTNYASGLCMAEMAALGAMERLDMMLSDSMYGILFRDINMQRTFIDQHFARRVQAYAGMIINTGEDNYLTTAEQLEEMHTVLASQFINRQFARLSHLPDAQLGLGHAFEMDPAVENGLLLSMADALLSRECFPDCPLKYMPPTKHIDGNIFQAHVMNSLFNLASVATQQHIHLVGILSEAVHTPFLHERFLAIQNTNYIFRYAKDFFNEFSLTDNGIMQQRAATVLTAAAELLERVAESGLPKAIEIRRFAGVTRSLTGGKGFDGVIEKSPAYYNPFDQLLKA